MNKINSLPNLKFRKARLLSLFLLSISLGAVSCKKDLLDEPKPYKALKENEKITSSDMAEWYSGLSFNPTEGKVLSGGKKSKIRHPFPIPLKWEKGEQKIINGKHVIRIPIDSNSCMVFTKEKNGEPLNPKIYLWQKDDDGNTDYTGKVLCFDFKDNSLSGQQFRNGKGSKIVKFEKKLNEDAVKALSKAGGKTSSIIGDILHGLGNLLGALACTISGGTWDNGPGGSIWNNTYGSFSYACPNVGAFWTIDWNSTSSTSSGSISDSYFLDIKLRFENAGSGSSGSGSWVNGTWSSGWGSSNGWSSGGWSSGSGSSSGGNGGSINVNDFFWVQSSTTPEVILQTRLGLDTEEYVWLQAHATFRDDLLTYIYNSPLTSQETNEIALSHLEELMNNPAYYQFVNTYMQEASTSASVNINNSSQKMWWQNDYWLDTKNFFNIDLYTTKLTAAEKALLKQYPILGFSLSANVNTAKAETGRLFGDPNTLNNNGDAFRHAFLSALNERVCGNDEYGVSIAKLFGDAHESEVPQQLFLEKEMDLFNNAVGRTQGYGNNEEISYRVYTKMKNGELRRLYPLLEPNEYNLDLTKNPNYDPSFYGGGDLNKATHGITMMTKLVPTY